MILCLKISGGIYLSNQGEPVSTNLTTIVPVEVLRKFHNFDSLSNFPLFF